MNNTIGTTTGHTSVDWHSYARCYDLLCEMNPAYADLISHFENFLRRIVFTGTLRALDLGAGTGNFVVAGARTLRASRWTHFDADEVMNEIAGLKYSRAALEIEVLQGKAQEAMFQAGSFDLIVSINAMYAMPEPERLLERMHSWLSPGGYLYLVDLGRVQNTLDWTQYLVRANRRRLGLRKTLSILLNEGRVISSQNRRITDLQRLGIYWRHSTTDLRQMLERSDFDIDQLETCYRGYSDRAIAHKTMGEARPEDSRRGCASPVQSLDTFSLDHSGDRRGGSAPFFC